MTEQVSGLFAADMTVDANVGTGTTAQVKNNS